MQSSGFPKLELKYCERCGGLWTRPQGGEEVYCGKCAKAMEELPPVKRRSPEVTRACNTRQAPPPHAWEGVVESAAGVQP